MKKVIILLALIIFFVLPQAVNATNLHHPLFGWWHRWSGWDYTNGPDNNASQTWNYESQNGNYIWDANGYLTAEVEHLVQEYQTWQTGVFESTVSSPVINCSNYSDVILTFEQNFFVSNYQSPYCEDNYQIGKVMATNGTDTHIYAVYEQDRDDSELVKINISNIAANQPNVRIQYYYKCVFFNQAMCGYEADSYWLIGDLYVDGYNVNETPGKSVSFAGDNDFVEIPNESAYDFTNAMTVEAWIKTDEFDRAWQAIVTKGDNSWRLHRNGNSNNINFVAGGTNVSGTTAVNDGEWHHLAGVHNGNNLYLYIDGNLDASSGSAGTTPNGSYNVMIGENAQATGRYFIGEIDEVRIWSTARSIDEIRENMHLTLLGNEPGLVSYFQFDQFADNRACDVVGYNDGYINNGAVRINSSVPVGGGYSYTHLIDSPSVFDFYEADLVMNVNTISAAGNFVVSKLTNSPNLNPDFDDPFDNQYWIIHNYDDVTIDTDATFTVSEDITAEDGLNSLHSFHRDSNSHTEWTFESAAVNADAANNELTFAGITDFSQFTLGRADVTTTITSLHPIDEEQEAYLSDDLIIHFSRDILPGTGSIHIFNTDDTLFETIPASVAVCTGNEASFNPINNFVLNSEYYIQIENDAFLNPFGNGFTIDDDTTWNFQTRNTDVFPGLCLDLNGTDSYVQIEGSVIPASGDFTVSLWAKADPAQTGYREIISQNAGATGEDFYIGRSDAGTIRVGDDWTHTGAAFPSDGLWHCYTVVKTDSGTLLYLDAYLAANTATAIQNPAGTEFRIGRQYGAIAEYFKGQIDEIKVWSSALTLEEIIANMNIVVNGTEPELTSYYQFYESTADRVIDLVSSYNSTFNNCSKISSTIPVGVGSGAEQVVTAIGSYDFAGTDVSIEVTAMETTGNMAVNKIEYIPNLLPDVDNLFDQQYWVFYEDICFEKP